MTERERHAPGKAAVFPILFNAALVSGIPGLCKAPLKTSPPDPLFNAGATALNQNDQHDDK
jgi:hypothetical protein